ncbi:MAG: SRPBCC family protein [Chloroflexi bacterium]|nr:SRPBCC family protein [Chloroflexota bacterium]
MAVLREQISTTLPLDEAFAFIADFANAEKWDPGVATSERVNPGPVEIGARYRLGIRMRGKVSPMVYEITTYEPMRRVVLTGTGSGVDAIDDIRFEATETGTRIDYIADIRLTGLLRLAAPFAGGALTKLVRAGRDGMQRTLDQLAATA